MLDLILSALEGANPHESRVVANTAVDGGTVDTCRTLGDTAMPYETGIKHPSYNDGAWVIVEHYDTKEEAQKGHDKWVKIMEGKPASITNSSKDLTADFVEAICGEGSINKTHHRKDADPPIPPQEATEPKA